MLCNLCNEYKMRVFHKYKNRMYTPEEITSPVPKKKTSAKEAERMGVLGKHVKSMRNMTKMMLEGVDVSELDMETFGDVR